MSQLNTKAAKLTEKYIKQSSESMKSVTRKKRGLQSEINKIASIKHVVISNDIDENELLRLRTSLYSLLNTVSDRLTENIITHSA